MVRYLTKNICPIRGHAAKNKQTFFISDNEFNNLEKEIILNLPKNLTCMVHFSDRIELQKACFSISPNGEVRVSIDDGEIIVGDLKTQEVKEIWSSTLFNKKLHYKRTSWLTNGNKLHILRDFLINNSNKESHLLTKDILQSLHEIKT